MQAVATTDAALAQNLLALWMRIQQGGLGRSFVELEELGLGLAQLKTLDALAHCAASPTVKDLAERLSLSLPGMSRNVDGLLRRGLVARREDEHDRRMKRLTVTDEGRAVLEKVNGARLAGLHAFVETLPPAHRDKLADALATILEGDQA
jgi:DNA-binding MarR family transcriptional regulator